jgi:hypothetical protein
MTAVEWSLHEKFLLSGGMLQKKASKKAAKKSLTWW